MLKPSRRFAVAPFDFDYALKNARFAQFSERARVRQYFEKIRPGVCRNRKSAKSSNEEEPAQIEHFLMSLALHAPCDGACIALPYIWFAYANNFGRE